MAPQTRVKICGITQVDDAQEVMHVGADAIGLVFYRPSPRCVTFDQAQKIAGVVGPFVSVVGLFVDADEQTVSQVLERVPLNLLQFHGNESREYCEQFKRPYLKALRMKPGLDVLRAIEQYPTASGILLDAYHKGVAGGTGEVFDWDRVPQNSPCPIVLAGGLNPINVRRAITAVSPYGVDVSSGVESTPGRKDIKKIVEFMKEIS